MSVQAIQSAAVERAAPAAPAGHLPALAARPHEATPVRQGTGQDQVEVSDEARRLSALPGQEPGSGLQLDPRKLRELAGVPAPNQPAKRHDND